MSDPLHGQWYDGTSSRAVDAVLHISEAGTLELITDVDRICLQWQKVSVGSRLGNAPRRIDFPGGGAFETADNDAVDRLVHALGAPSGTWLHGFETNRRLIAAAAVILIALGWGVFKYGIPAASKSIAAVISPAILEPLGRETLSGIDHIGLQATALSDARRDTVAEQFETIVDAADMDDLTCRIEFRSAAKTFGPNAFALPPCLVVLTDELVNISANEDELTAVLAHEIGHIKHRHSLRRIIQDTFLTFILMMMTGDATQISAALAAAPAVLLELGYARDMEREADLFAAHYMRAAGIPLQAFPTILQRMETWRAEDACDGKACAANEDRDDDTRFFDYFSTHPPSGERAQMFEGTDSVSGQ